MIKKTSSIIKNILKGKYPFSSRFQKESSENELNYDVLPYEEWKESWKKIFYKEYPRFAKIPLMPNEQLIKEYSLLNALKERSSKRDFQMDPLSFTEFSTLLFYSAGINPGRENEAYKKRFFPSGGTRFPNEVYILVNEKGVENLEKATYHFNVKRDHLEKMFSIEEPQKFIHQLSVQDWVQRSNFIICISAVFDRSRVKYGERGYRYGFIEAGHIAQNIYLLSAALKLKCCALGGFSDVKINTHLGLDGKTESILYMISIGK
jgi:SagB-type dehydrogenase family enzyme